MKEPSKSFKFAQTVEIGIPSNLHSCKTTRATAKVCQSLPTAKSPKPAKTDRSSSAPLTKGCSGTGSELVDKWAEVKHVIFPTNHGGSATEEPVPSPPFFSIWLKFRWHNRLRRLVHGSGLPVALCFSYTNDITNLLLSYISPSINVSIKAVKGVSTLRSTLLRQPVRRYLTAGHVAHVGKKNIQKV